MKHCIAEALCNHIQLFVTLQPHTNVTYWNYMQIIVTHRNYSSAYLKKKSCPIRHGTLWAWSKCYPTTTKSSVFYYLPIVSCNLVSIKIIIIIIIIIILTEQATATHWSAATY